MMEPRFDPGKEIIEVDGNRINIKELLLKYKKTRFIDLDLRGYELDSTLIGEYIYLEYTCSCSGILIVVKIKQDGKNIDKIRSIDGIISYPHIYNICNLGESSHIQCFNGGYVHYESKDFGILDIFSTDTGKSYFITSDALDSVDMIVTGNKPSGIYILVHDIHELFDTYDQYDWDWSIIGDKAIANNQQLKLKCTFPLDDKNIDRVLIEYL